MPSSVLNTFTQFLNDQDTSSPECYSCSKSGGKRVARLARSVRITPVLSSLAFSRLNTPMKGNAGRSSREPVPTVFGTLRVNDSREWPPTTAKNIFVYLE
ncbi:hypothetical protein IFM47457_07331 [Aspergillus lentulus]|nr:hypothetical protein IFM47457_07331 [Aspergillus lentulus]